MKRFALAALVACGSAPPSHRGAARPTVVIDESKPDPERIAAVEAELDILKRSQAAVDLDFRYARQNEGLSFDEVVALAADRERALAGGNVDGFYRLTAIDKSRRADFQAQLAVEADYQTHLLENLKQATEHTFAAAQTGRADAIIAALVGPDATSGYVPDCVPARINIAAWRVLDATHAYEEALAKVGGDKHPAALAKAALETARDGLASEIDEVVRHRDKLRKQLDRDALTELSANLSKQSDELLGQLAE